MDETPDVLKGLSKFENDAKLVNNFDAWWKALCDATPDIDHALELRNAHLWLLTNEGTTKGNKRAYKPFLTRWFKRGQQWVNEGKKQAFCADAHTLTDDELPNASRYAKG
jgi:hypothetical protein